MKKLIIIFCFCSFFQFSFAQKSSSGMCKVDVEDITNVASFGYLIGYTVKFKNNSKSTVDGIWWTSYYYDNSGDLVARFHKPAVSYGDKWRCEIVKEGIDKRLLIFIPCYLSSSSSSSKNDDKK